MMLIQQLLSDWVGILSLATIGVIVYFEAYVVRRIKV